MARNISTVYVANLPWFTTEDELATLFTEHVPVVGVRVIQDKATGRSRGFAFVELEGPEDVQKVISRLNGCGYRGRKLIVTSARPKRTWP